MKTEIKTAIIFSILILILVIAIAFFYNNTEFNSNNAVNVNKSNLLHVPSMIFGHIVVLIVSEHYRISQHGVKNMQTKV